MSTTYQKFLKRLKEERLRLMLSQSDIGQLLRMSQSHYSKAELGTRRFTYYEIQCLCETEVELFFIFSGDKSQVEIDESYSECSFKELTCYLEIICVVLASLHDAKILALPEKIQKKIENIQYVLMPCEKDKTIFYKLRRSLNYNQIKMADLLEVDVKKLRSMESGKVLPDSEIIWRLSETFYIPYALLFER